MASCRWIAHFGLFSALVALPVFAGATGCGTSTRDASFSDDDDNDDDDDDDSKNPGDAPSFGSTTDAGDDDDDPSNSDDCAESAKLVYVTGYGSKLYSFDPSSTDFKEIGVFSCLGGQLPTHMTVDRQGTAWIVSDGKLYTASTKDATCTPVTNWKKVSLFPDFALTFVGTSGADHTLYLMNTTGRLGSFDTSSGAVTVIKDKVDFTTNGGDMTSNGDGSLYYANNVSGHPLYKIDSASGSTISNSQTAAGASSSQALAFWGGIFYVFVGSDIYAHDPTTKKTPLIGKAPLMVTGAGQSTCVPKVAPPPK